MSNINEEEQDFPIAFSIMMYKDLELAERLLRAIYQPQNYYCIHVDKKSNKSLHRAVSAIADCFDNVFLASKTIAVHWGTFRQVKAELVCMKDMWKYKTWKYYINLTGQEFPLKTNAELVQILTVYNGSNDIRGTLDK